MKRPTSTILACLTWAALASLSAQDLTITNARIDEQANGGAAIGSADRSWCARGKSFPSPGRAIRGRRKDRL